ncbi:MAG TPA: MAPEG family protein [Reyranella sp.]|nr:MAPEG family protein [Reyranella sp.]
MTVFFICAGLLGLMIAVLVILIGRMRTAKKISLGDGGDPEMTALIRTHGNLVETAPFCLLLIYVAHGPYGERAVMILSVLLLVFRLLHAGGMLGYVSRGRIVGAVGTTVVTVAASVMLIAAGLRGL